MSSFKRLLEIAKSEVGALREKVSEKVADVSDRVSSGGSRRLENYSDDELSMEIERRRLAKKIKEEEDAKKAAEGTSGPAAGQAPGPAKEAPPERPRRSRRPPPPGPPIVSKTLEQYYANLEVDVGADLETIKRAYRRLMRKYHPDKHAGDPTKYKAATELAQSLTKAYMELKKHLEAQGQS